MAVVHNADFLLASALQTLAQAANSEVVEVARHVAEALRSKGFEALVVSVVDDLEDLGARLKQTGAELVFNLVESLGGSTAREPEVPEFLAAHGWAFTGCGARGLELAHDKPEAKRVLASAGILVPRGFVVRPGEGFVVPDLRYPLFVKPAEEDGSIGVDQASVVRAPNELAPRVQRLTDAIQGPALIEEYLPGAEINVAIVDTVEGQRSFPTTIDFSSLPKGLAPIVTYAGKWEAASPEYTIRSVAAESLLPAEVVARAEATARAAYRALEGRGVGRVDLRLDAEGRPNVIDVNPNPDLHPEAGLTVAAGYRGVAYADLIESIVRFARREARSEKREVRNEK
ncbi:MAG: hypothetical protein HYV07_15535 [Deltaproteobacteria bacterium]|nr:hypothetical protein [Deltaproteobacteria bacterium]